MIKEYYANILTVLFMLFFCAIAVFANFTWFLGLVLWQKIGLVLIAVVIGQFSSGLFGIWSAYRWAKKLVASPEKMDAFYKKLSEDFESVKPSDLK